MDRKPTSSPRQTMFSEALRHHHAGRLDEAEKRYLHLLRLDQGNADAWHMLGLVALQIDRPVIAEDLIGRALALKDDVPDFLNHLGSALHAQGKMAAAEAAFRRALAGRPNYVEAHFNLGIALRALGRLAEAEASHRLALTYRPHYAEAHCNLGIVLREQGKLADAVASYRRALTHQPDYPEAYCNLGTALQAQGHPAEAVAAFDSAIARRPDFAEAHSNRGNVLLEQGRLAEAFASYRLALRHKPALAGVHCNLGNILQIEGNLEAAAQAYRRSLVCQPDLAEAQCNYGSALRDLGQFDSAMILYQRAIECDPSHAKFHYGLAEIKRFTAADDPGLFRMERLAEDVARLPPDAQVNLHFALGKAYDDLEEHDRSFAHFIAGSRLKRRLVAYDEAAELARFDRIRAAFTPDLIRSKSSGVQPADGPIFILGMPRSGTSLVEQILASHPGVFGAGELTLFEAVLPDMAVALPAAELRHLGARYRAALRDMAPDSPRITDKLPQNFLACGLIHLALPDARIIHVRRDPIDTCLSCFSKLFTTGHSYSYDLGELGRYYRRYAALMDHWRSVLPEGVMQEVRYEDVVADLEGEARRILAHCGLAWDPACLAFAETKRPVRTASATQVRQPLYAKSINRWRPPADLLHPLTDALA